MMKLFIAPGACSLAPHIAALEAGIALETVVTDFAGEYHERINPKGLVPALQIDAHTVLTETPVILQYLADLAPPARLLPPVGSLERLRVLEWLAYIASELHKGFGNPKHSDESGEVIARRLCTRFSFVDQALRAQASGWLTTDFSVADLHLFTVSRWVPLIGLDRGTWPALSAHFERVAAHEATRRALTAEGLEA